MARAKSEEPIFIVAPTERNALKTLIGEHGTVAMLPEKFGCDIIWRAHDEWWGVQRKELADFIASIQDGRLAREIAQMRAMPLPTVVIEGRIHYTDEDLLMYNKRSQRITRMQFYGMQWSLMKEGIHVAYTNNTSQTAEFVAGMARWSIKEKHQSLLRRPGPYVSAWGSVDNLDYAYHLLQGFDGLGLDRARAIVSHFQGVPLQWTVTEKELMKVPGIGKKLAQRMIDALEKIESHEAEGKAGG